MPTGTLQIYTLLAGGAAPLANVTLTVTDAAGALLATLLSGTDGAAPPLAVEAPDRSYSLDETNTTVLPYAICNVQATAEGWRPVTVEGVQIFDGQTTIARLELLPAEDGLAPIADAPILIPEHPLFAGGGGSGPAPTADLPAPAVLDEVIIPRKITVHLGRPTASASNVTVPFQDYIANVASSEVYPTWPEQALRANILAQISLALNRIWTEWYPSRGYSFNITNSPGYDQAYVSGRTVFAVMERLTAELFNTYVRRSGTVEPYFTEYCDGKSVTCPGMKQWGTVDRANAGLSALQILRYYYGNSVQLVTSTNIASIPQSYPGSPLRSGASGTAVSTIQRQLARISKDYPSFGKPAVTGVYDAATEASVRKFQSYFSLGADGVVGRSTWYKISYIYVSVKDLAELTSEGETFTGAQSAGAWPGTVLRRGATGTAVEQVQFWLSDLAQYNDALPRITVDGTYGAATVNAVRIFQQENSLTADGIVGQTTWEALYDAWVEAQSDIGGTAWPGTALRSGSRGMQVRLVQFWLRVAADYYPTISAPTVDGNFGSGTAAAVRAFQTRFGLTADGVVGRATWNKLREVSLAIFNKLVDPGIAPGQYTRTVRVGSSGTPVRAVQYYLRQLSAYYSTVPQVTVDGVFGDATRRAVVAWQRLAGLAADGVVGRLTWESLYTAAQTVAASGPVARRDVAPVPAATLRLGERSDEVLTLSRILLFLGQWLPQIPLQNPADATATFNAALEQAVRGAQRLFGLPQTGQVSPADWRVFAKAAAALFTVAPGASAPEPDGVWPGAALAQGSAGPAVRNVQQWLNRIAAVQPEAPFVPETGEFGAATASSLEEYQISAGLQPLGVVDDPTWLSLQAAAARSCEDCGGA